MSDKPGLIHIAQRRIIMLLLCQALLLCFFTATAEGDSLFLIRDAEVEDTLTDMARNIFKAAKLDPETARVYVIRSSSINAFTIGNGHIFVHSGLLLKFSNPLHIMAILCHETAHIAAGHVSRLMAAFQTRNTNFIAAAIAGILGSAITGSADAMAILLGYAISDERFFLKYSRGEEFAADALAARYLMELGYSPSALTEVFYEFDRLDILSGGINLPIYVKSHPKAVDRISAIGKFISDERKAAAKDMVERYRRVVLKLKSYLKSVNFIAPPPDDYYSRAIYLHRIGKTTEAINLIKKLVKNNPNDVYYQETLAQLMYESGRLEESIEIYKAICNAKINILTKIDYANVLSEHGKDIDTAISILESAKHIDYPNEAIFRLLAKCYGKKKRKGLSMLMLAREQALRGNYARSFDLLEGCLKILDPKTEQQYIKQANELKKILERDHRWSI
jgi:predicted Zn-dependent protease